MVEGRRSALRFSRLVSWVLPVWFCFPCSVEGQTIEHDGIFLSLAVQSSVGVHEAVEVVAPDFGGRAVVASQGIEILVNDPWNHLWPFAVALEFLDVPITIQWTSANRIYVELDESGWELLYSTDLGPELWKPIGDHPRSRAKGPGWIVDLTGETSPSLFRGRWVE